MGHGNGIHVTIICSSISCHASAFKIALNSLMLSSRSPFPFPFFCPCTRGVQANYNKTTHIMFLHWLLYCRILPSPRPGKRTMPSCSFTLQIFRSIISLTAGSTSVNSDLHFEVLVIVSKPTFNQLPQTVIVHIDSAPSVMCFSSLGFGEVSAEGGGNLVQATICSSQYGKRGNDFIYCPLLTHAPSPTTVGEGR
jgi:hypothetical protein